MPRRCSGRPLMAWRGAVGGTGAVEVGQDVLAAADQGSGQGLDLLQPVGDGLPQGVDEPSHQVLSQSRVLGAVGLDEALVDAPGGLDRSVAIISEQVLQALGLGIGEQTGPGQQGAPSPVEPVTRPAPPPCDRPLDAPAALSGPGEAAPWLPPRPAHARTRPERRARS